MGILQQEKDNLYKELKESRYEVATLTEEKDSAKSEYEKELAQSVKEFSKLQAKNKGNCKLFHSLQFFLMIIMFKYLYPIWICPCWISKM